jgi:predicted dehydrogenase
LVGVADLQEERALKAAHQLGCSAFTDYRRLIPMVDAVSLAVPTQSHSAMGAVLLEAGIHVLVEKPIAADLAGAERLIRARDDAGVVLQVGHTERFNPAIRAVLPLLKRPLFFEAHRLGVFVPRSLDVDVVLDLMIHDLDLVLRLTQTPIAELRAVGVPVLTPRVDIANARIEFENGCVANLTASRVSKERIRKLRFFQAHDYVSIDFQARSVEMFSLTEKREGNRTIIERAPEVEDAEPLRVELETFLDAVQGKPSQWACSAEEGKESLMLALRIVDQMRR